LTAFVIYDNIKKNNLQNGVKMYKRIVIDRIENNVAVCEAETESGELKTIFIPFSQIDGEINEGFELIKKGENYISKRNEAKEEEMKRRLNNLFERTKNRKGDK
jgi:hypothetical protein